MLTEIISNCSCCGLPCCKSTSAPLWQYTWLYPYGSACYNSSKPRTYNLRDVDFPYKNQDNDIVNLKDFSCFAEEGFTYKWNLKGIGNGQVDTDISGEIDEEGVLVGLPNTISVYCRYGAVGTLTCSRKKIGELDTAIVYKNFTLGSSGCPQGNINNPLFTSSISTDYKYYFSYYISIKNILLRETLVFDFYFAWYLSIPQVSAPFDIRISRQDVASSSDLLLVEFIFEKEVVELPYPYQVDYYPRVPTNDTHSTCPTASSKKFTITLTPIVIEIEPGDYRYRWSYSIQWHVPYE